MSHQIDTFSIHNGLLLDFLYQTGEIAGVIDAGVSEAVDGICGVPELVSREVNRAIRVAVEEPARFGQRLNLPVALLVGPAGGIPVQEDHQGNRRLAVVLRGNV